MKVCILYGGTSSEREVSVNTGNSIYNSINKDYNVIKYDFDGNYDNLYNAIKNVDLVFIALHGGEGENGTVQKFLETKNIKFTGSNSKASKKAMDKDFVKLLCKKHNIPTPNWFKVDHGRDLTELREVKKTFFSSHDGKGFVVKPVYEGSSFGITIFKKPYFLFSQELKKAIGEAFKVSSTEIMLEQYIDGRELTVSILNDNVLPIVEIVPKGDYYDYKCKYTKLQSEYIVPAKIDKKTEELLFAYSLKIHKLTGCGVYSRSDFRLSENGKIFFLEINTLPGFTDTSLFPKAAKALGLNYKDLINKIIKLSI